MPAKRILVCGDNIFDYTQGGAARVVMEIALELKRRNWEVILLIRGRKNRPEFEIYRGLEVYRHKNNLFSAFRFLKGIFSRKVDCVNFHDPYSSFIALLYLIFRGADSQRIYTFQSPWPSEYYIRAVKKGLSLIRLFFGVHFRRELEKFVLKNSDKIIVASDFMRRELSRLYGLKASVLPLGVDLERFSPLRPGDPVPEEMKPAPGGRVFFTLRNLEPRIGLENLLQAVKTLSDGGRKNLRFVIGGGGTLEGELKKTASELGIEHMVRFTGYIPEEKLRFYYGAADAFILPTKELEGFGLVTLEAMACGCPVLATPVGANPEVAGGFGRNVIFKSEKAGDMAAGIEKFLKTGADERGRCREYAEKNYSWSRYADGFEKVSAACPLCGGYGRLAPEGFVKCRGCGLFYKPYGYANSTRSYGEDAGELIYDSSVRGIFSFVLDKMKLHGFSGGKLLDIGCASGNFMELSAKYGWNPQGVEISGELAAACRAKGFTVYEKPVEESPLPEAVYDAVTVFSVFSQMEDPFSAVRKIEKLLKPGGLLVIREYNSWFHRMAYKAVSVLSFLKVEPYIFHKWNFSKKSLSFLLESNGFEPIFFGNSPLTEGDPYGTGGRLGKAGVSLFKSLYSLLAETVYHLSFRKIFISSSIMVFARKKG